MGHIHAENPYICGRHLSNNTCSGIPSIGKCGGSGKYTEPYSCGSFSKSPLTSPMPREPYEGTSRKLVLAFDIGTTYSGAAYAFL